MAFKKWKKLSQKTIFKNSHWQYNVDHFEIDGVGSGEYHYVHTFGSTMLIPITSEKKIILVNQFRYLNGKNSLEFPCGAVEKNLSLEENAQKELREETGFAAEKLLKAGAFSPYTGASDEICTVFIASKLCQSPLPMDITEEIDVMYFSFDEVDNLVKSNEIWDGLSLSAWTITRDFIYRELHK